MTFWHRCMHDAYGQHSSRPTSWGLVLLKHKESQEQIFNALAPILGRRREGQVPPNMEPGTVIPMSPAAQSFCLIWAFLHVTLWCNTLAAFSFETDSARIIELEAYTIKMGRRSRSLKIRTFIFFGVRARTTQNFAVDQRGMSIWSCIFRSSTFSRPVSHSACVLFTLTSRNHCSS